MYCGLTALICALIGLNSKRREWKICGIVLILSPLVIILFTPLFLILYYRFFVVIPFGIGILAALGMECTEQYQKRFFYHSKFIKLGLITAIILTLLLGTLVQWKQSYLIRKIEPIALTTTSYYKTETSWNLLRGQETVKNFSLTGNATIRFAIISLILLSFMELIRRRKKYLIFAPIFFLLFNTANTLQIAWQRLPSVNHKYDFPTTPAIDFLKKDKSLFRILSSYNINTSSPVTRPNMLLPYSISIPMIYEALIPKFPLLKKKEWNRLGVKYFLVALGTTFRKEGMPNVKKVYSGEIDIYENSDVFPRIYFSKDGGITPDRTTKIEISQYTSGDIRFSINAPQEGDIIIGERFYPGWKGKANGSKVPLKEFMNQLQKISVSEGKTNVELRYKPFSVLLGGLLSLAGIFLCCISIFTRRRK